MNNNVVKEKEIIDLFFLRDDSENIDYEKAKKYQVPLYQRAYRWREELCEMLFNDITEPKDYSKQYNFGFITLAKLPGKVNEFDIIDGQQRTISIYLLVLAMYSSVSKISPNAEDYLFLSKFSKSGIPFKSNVKTNNSLIKVLEDSLNNKDIVYEDTDNKTVIDNYNTFKRLISLKIEKNEQNDLKIKGIIDMFNTLSSQKVFILEFEKRQNALENFIALNMKSEELDKFEVLSALLLSKIKNIDKEIEYRTKLDEVYKLSLEIKIFPNFDSYLFNLIWTQYGLYRKYCENNELLKKEVRISMPNHYVENFFHLQSQAEKFIDNALFITEKYIEMESKGKISWLLQYVDESDKSTALLIEKRIKTVSYLMKTENIKTVVITQRYILSLLYVLKENIARKSKTAELNMVIAEVLNEIVLLLCEQHVLNIVDTIRISKEYQNITKPKDLRTVRKSWCTDKDLEKQTIFTTNKIINSLIFQTLDNKKLGSLKVFYQIRSSSDYKVIKKGTEVIIEPDSDENLEHFFIDKTRAKVLPSKNAIGFNTFMIPQALNTDFAKLKLNNFLDKVNYILSKSENEYKKYVWFYTFCKVAKNVFDKLNYKSIGMKKNRFNEIKGYYKKGDILLEQDLNDFLIFHEAFLKKIKQDFIIDFISRLENFLYEDYKILENY